MEKNMKFDVAFVDLDKTIYDTDHLLEDMWSVAQRHEVQWSDYDKTFMASLHSVNIMQYDYSFEEHLNLLKDIGYEIKHKFLEEMNSLAQNNYLFSESKEFINFLKTQSERVVLLTAGDKHFQMNKIIGCGAEKLFDEILVSEIPKVEYVRQYFTGQPDKALFINDNLKENEMVKRIFPELTVVCKFNPKKYSEEEMQKSGLPYFKTLPEIEQYVIKL